MMIFNEPQLTFTHRDGTYNYICNREIKPGDEIGYMIKKVGGDTAMIARVVSEVIEVRPARGNFEPGDRPNFYRLTFKDTAATQGAPTTAEGDE